MKVKALKKNKLIRKRKLGKAGQTLALPEGYSSLLVLSEKYGYAKDYIGWLSRTGRIEAIRSGKYGQWYASPKSLKTYISSLVTANEQRYSAQRSSMSTKAIAELAVSRTDIASLDKDEDHSAPRVPDSTSSIIRADGPDTDSRIISSNEDIDKSISIEGFESSDLVTRQTPSVPSTVLSEDNSSSSAREIFTNKSSLSAEKQLAKRINAAFTASMLLGGILIFVYFFSQSGQFSFKDASHSVGQGVTSSLSYLWNKFFKGFGENIYITIVGGERGEKGESGRSGATVIKEVKITEGLTPEQINTIYGKIDDTNSKIDILTSRVLSLSSTQPPVIYPSFQLPPTNTQGIGPITLNPNKVETEKLIVSGPATFNTIVTRSDVSIGGYASASKYFGAGLVDCDDESKTLNWDATTGRFSCLADGGGGGSGSALEIKEGLASILNPTASISFEAGAFNVTVSGSTEAVVRLDYTNGPASRSIDQTITGLWNFNKRLEVQGTASASYLLTGNTLQVGGFASAAYSRFGTDTTTHVGTISGINDLLISGGLEVNGSVAFDGFTLLNSNASVSGNFEVTGAGSSSFAGSLNIAKGLTANSYQGGGLANCTGKLLYASGQFSCGSATSGSVASNSLDFDEIVNTMTLDSDLRINTPSGRRIGIGAAPSTYFEVQGTASASYLLTGNTLQVGGFASAAYSRFGTGTTSEAHYINGPNDLFITEDLEVNGSVSFAGPASISNVLYVSPLSNPGNVGIGTANPAALLDLRGLSGNTSELILGLAATNYAGTIQYDNTGSTFLILSTNYTNDNNTAIILKPGNIEALRVLRSGFVGIGTTTPTTKFEVQGTASASYLLTGNTLQVGGFASAAYSRFGTSTTGHSNYISTTNDLLISGDLEVKSTASFAGNASISGLVSIGNNLAGSSGVYSLVVNSSDGGIILNRTGTNESFVRLTTDTASSGGQLRGLDAGGLRFTNDTAVTEWARFDSTGKFGIGATVPDQLLTLQATTPLISLKNSSGTTKGYVGLSGGVDGIINGSAAGDMVIRAQAQKIIFSTDSGTTSHLVINTAGFVGIGTGVTPSTKFEVQGTASASYLLTGNTLQVGGFASAAYSRFGTSTTGHANYISTTNDLLISGDLELVGTASFRGAASLSGTFTSINTGSNSFSGGLEVSKGVHATGAISVGDALRVNGQTILNGIFTLGDNGDTGEINTSDWDIGTTGNLSGIGTIAADGAYTQTGTGANTFSGATTFSATGTALLVSAGRSEFQGTASASYLLTGNTLQVGGFASAAYSRFGTSTTNKANFISASNDLLISSDLEVLGSISANIASASVFWLPATTGTRLGDCDAAGDTLNWDLATGKFVCGSDASGSVASNSLDFDEFVNSMTLDSNLTINRGGFKIGIGAAPSTVFEVQGTASASYFVASGSVQFGSNVATASYSRFGGNATGYSAWFRNAQDLLISGDLEVDSSAQFDSFVRISNGSSRSFVITDAGGTKQDVFVVNTLASSSNSGLTITAGPAQVGPLFELKSSGGTILSKFSEEGGQIINVASTSAFMVTSPDFPTASTTFTINTLNGLATVRALSSKSVGFQVAGIASVSSVLLVGPTNFDGAPASASKFFGKGGIWVTGAICADDKEDATTDCGDANRSSGTVYAVAGVTTVGDVGENFPTLDGHIEAGDLVGLDYQEKLMASGSLKFMSEFVKKASSSDVILGVITEKPGLLLAGWGNKQDPRSIQEVAVALSGRIPAKVSLENGPIEPGDRLVASSIPGVAMRATHAGMTIGIALEPLASGSLEFSSLASDSFGNSASVSYGKVLTFVNLTYWVPDVADILENIASSSAETGAFGNPYNHSFIFRVVVDMFKDMFDIVFENGLIKIAEIITDKLTANQLCLEDLCVNKTQLQQLLDNDGIAPAPSNTPVPTLETTPEITPTPSPELTPETTPTPSETPLSSETPIPAPEITPTPEPTPEPSPGI